MDRRGGKGGVKMFGMAGAVGLLTAGCIFDVQSKKIPLFILGAGGMWSVAGLIIKAIETGISQMLLFAIPAILPGAVLLILSFLTEKKIGYGDGMVLMILGCMEGIRMAFLVFCIGLFLQSLFAVGLLIAKKADKQSCIPFMPFLLAGRMALFVF